MSTDKAADVDVIANPGIVARRIIDTVDSTLDRSPSAASTATLVLRKWTPQEIEDAIAPLV
jgi:hypothetical protein